MSGSVYFCFAQTLARRTKPKKRGTAKYCAVLTPNFSLAVFLLLLGIHLKIIK